MSVYVYRIGIFFIMIVVRVWAPFKTEKKFIWFSLRDPAGTL